MANKKKNPDNSRGTRRGFGAMEEDEQRKVTNKGGRISQDNSSREEDLNDMDDERRSNRGRSGSERSER